MLPNNRRETIQVNPDSSVAELQDFAIWIEQESDGRSSVQDENSSEALSEASLLVDWPSSTTSSANNNSRKAPCQSKESENDELISKESVERTNRTIQNALQSLLSLDQEQQERGTAGTREGSEKKRSSKFGEI